MGRLSTSSAVRIGIDIGGTFTDFVLINGSERHTYKRLTTADAPERAVLEGLVHLMHETGVGPSQLGAIVHGTTLATNAVIERRGARTALLTTVGFRDVIETGHEARADQYDLRVGRPAPLIPRDLRFVASGRLDAHGEELVPLDEVEIGRIAGELVRNRIESVAIGFLHSYVSGRHEARAAEILSQHLPDLSISLSSDVSPEIREFERFSTTCVNAYVRPLMCSYLERLSTALGTMGIRAPLLLITSDGGLCDVSAACRYPVRLLESGPAGGALLAAHIGESLALDRVLSLDIGGTTAKLCFIDNGVPQKSRSLEVARLYRFKPGSGIPLRIPVVELSEIGAGGGSIASVDSLQRVHVGPRSAGSQPGPACYGLGGTEPTLTDSHLVAGRLDPEYFAAGTLALNTDAASAALAEAVARPLGAAIDDAAYAVAELADEAMASAAREHAIELGKSIAGRTLVAFGGSAPLHAARLADKLGIDKVVIPTAAGVGSAYGFLIAPVAFEAGSGLYQPLASLDVDAVNSLLASLLEQAQAVVGKVVDVSGCDTSAWAHMRYSGQGHEIQVALPSARLVADDAALTLRCSFEDIYRERFGRPIANARIEVLSWSVRLAEGKAAVQSAPLSPSRPDAAGEVVPPFAVRSVFDQASRRRTDSAFYRRTSLTADARVSGPAVVVDDETTIVVPPAFFVWRTPDGHLVLERMSHPASAQQGAYA